jgi:carboxylate-amine ligase
MSYGEVAEKMIEWGASLDPGMLYYDVRVAQHYPTVEIRVADVCTEPEEAGLVTALARALVDTCAKDWRAGTPTARWRSELLRVASWRAAKFGMAGPLVHPQCQQLSPFRETFDALLDYVAGSLSDSGDEDFVRGAFARMTARGSGAARQRRRYADTGSLEAVVEDLSERTERSWHETE